jgi:WD40 repeat protein
LNENTLASGSTDGSIKILGTKTGNLLKNINGNTNQVHFLVVLPDKNSASCSDDQSNDLVYFQIKLLSDNTLASGSEYRTIKIWDTKNGVLLKEINGHTLTVGSLAALPYHTLAS